jgi:hypothetical protein
MIRWVGVFYQRSGGHHGPQRRMMAWVLAIKEVMDGSFKDPLALSPPGIVDGPVMGRCSSSEVVEVVRLWCRSLDKAAEDENWCV